MMVFSKEQEDIFDFAKNGIQNLIVQAVAGAGKTTTLVECANRIDPSKRVMLLAHNKSTRDTLKSRIGDKPNVRIYTLHGLAYRMYIEKFGEHPDIDDDKYRNYINHNIDELATEEYHSLHGPIKLAYKSNLFDIINKARHNLKQSEKEIKKLAVKKYGIPLVADECRMAADVLKWGLEHREKVDFQDLIWFPYEFGYFTKNYTADVIMLDEAQDASLAQQDVVSRCFTRTTRLFAFGDKDQTINSWCGSDTEAFENLNDSDKFRRPAKELPLTTNYRCGRNIIEYAKQYCDNNIHASENAPEGIIRHEAHLSETKSGDMILCRVSAPLMEVYRKGVQQGLKLYFRGEELGKNLILDADCADGDTIPEIILSMKRKLIGTWDFLTEQSGLDCRETMTDNRILSLLDTIKTMESLPKTVEKRRDLEKFVKDVFSNEGKEGIQLSTIHRAKGLEADNVFIICPSLIPSKLATLDWQKEEERHLLYVMCTRPKISLNFVSEKEIRPHSAFAEGNSLYKELEKIKEEVRNEKTAEAI